VVLANLGFIHIAHWAALDRLPHVDPAQPPDALPSKYLVFVSNFNGARSEYIEMFSDRIARRIGNLYRSAVGFPGPVPASSLVGYVERHAFDAQVFYSAYPGATTRMVTSALKVQQAVAGLQEQSGDDDPASFRSRWTTFLRAVGRDL